MDWIIYKQEDYTLCKIRVFDDGKERFKQYANKWYVIGTNNRGKIKLKNIENNKLIINSISDWKVIHSDDLKQP